MMRVLLLLGLLLATLLAEARAEWCEDFAHGVFSISISEQSPEVRSVKYEALIYETVRKVSSERGPSWNPAPLNELLNRYIASHEAARVPPPGWQPKASRDNLLLFSDLARTQFELDLELIRLCTEKTQ